ncbi:N1R/p28 family protein [Flamingopox virus FGPVKD09]|uniref:N1R/p28 family protein n=1 Tax=Flamingopox virus FGPVKD09 TaxID=2059380 RepID=A0A2H4X2P6_9POXV|nr:N1R/p28 family protein [Flamingopox virus FGPVKD09]AUD40343.1 N1R/p28 family protein [Flamingopox virus FGPVKD09]
MKFKEGNNTIKMMNITDIKIYSINKCFMSMKLLDVEVVIMRSNGFVNITRLCNSEGKNFNDWKQLESSKRLLNVLKDNCELHDPIINIKRTRIKINGEYVSQLLLDYVITWISPYITTRVSILMRYYRRCIALNIETEKDIEYSQELQNQISNIDEVYDKFIKDISNHFKEIETSYYNKLSTYLLKKAERVLEKDYSKEQDVENNEDNHIDEMIDSIESEIKENNRYYMSSLNNVRKQQTEDHINISNIILSGDPFNEMIVKIRNYIETRAKTGE